MNKKGQGMSLNVIIIATLGLLVLVILAAVFVGRTGVFTKSVDRCSGNCVAAKNDCAGTYDKIASGSCDLDGDGKPTDNSFVAKNEKDGFCCISAAPQ